MADQFNPGDVAILKSGGPPMTVAQVGSDGRFWCQWFDTKGTQGQYFQANVLKLAKTD